MDKDPGEVSVSLIVEELHKKLSLYHETILGLMIREEESVSDAMAKAILAIKDDDPDYATKNNKFQAAADDIDRWLERLPLVKIAEIIWESK